MSKQTCCDKNMGEPFTCGQLSQEVRYLQQRITELEQELAESRQSNKDFCETVTLQLSRLAELESRYAGAVEVEGVISSVIRTSDYTEAIVVSITPQCIWGIIDQRVRVLVKEVE